LEPLNTEACGILKIENFDMTRNEYNLGFAPEVNQGYPCDSTMISSMSSISTKPAKIKKIILSINRRKIKQRLYI
jgi:hypothetical protein